MGKRPLRAGPGDLELDARLRRAAELVASSRLILAQLGDNATGASPTARAELDRRIVELINAADAVDAALFGLALGTTPDLGAEDPVEPPRPMR